MAAQLTQQFEGLGLTEGASSSSANARGVEVIDGSVMSKLASNFYRQCLRDNMSRGLSNQVDPINYAMKETEKKLLGSKPWNYCKYVNSMSREELMVEYKNKLVRFRGMVQEAYDPVMYQAYGNVIRQGRKEQDCFLFMNWGDWEGNLLEPSEETNYKGLRDMDLYHAISVPGENQWMRELAYGYSRMKIYQEGSKYEEFNSVAQRNATFSFPLPEMYEDDMLKACIIKVYNPSLLVRMNQVYDFYGVLSLETEYQGVLLHNRDFERAFDDEAEQMIRDPPPHYVPRIHCISALPVTSEMVLNLIPRTQIREDFSRVLEKVLLDIFMGDEIVMKYVLCNLVSSVDARVYATTPVGSFPLMISDINANANKLGNTFAQVVQTIVPKSYFISDLSTAAETMRFASIKDYRINKLSGGLLQLSDGTHLIVQDLTRTNDIQNLGNGPNSKAQLNFQTLEKLIERQALEYDFKFNNSELNHDIPVVILSRSRNNLKPRGLTVIPWCRQVHDNALHEEVVIPNMMHFLKNPEAVNNIRFYLQQIKMKKFQQIPEALSDLITGDFVRSRQNNDASRHMTQEDFNRCFTMTKYFAKLYSDGEITYDAWKEVLSLESERKRRLAEIPCVN